jgi:hypothetical protein
MSKNLLSLLLLVATFAVYYLLIGPLYKGTGGVWQPTESVQSLMALNTEYDQTLALADSLYSQATSLQAQYSKISVDDKAKMAIMVPESIDKVRLLSEVSNLVESTGLTASDIGVTDGNSALPGRGVMNVSFTVKTNYPKFKELMDDVEKSMRLYSIQNVTFSAPAKEGDLTSYQVQLQTYYLK